MRLSVRLQGTPEQRTARVTALGGGRATALREWSGALTLRGSVLQNVFHCQIDNRLRFTDGAMLVCLFRLVAAKIVSLVLFILDVKFGGMGSTLSLLVVVFILCPFVT